MIEKLDLNPTVSVPEPEFRRLLGYPEGEEPGDRAKVLAQATREWYANHGDPWVYLREASLEISEERLRIDGIEFISPKLVGYLHAARARTVILAAASAGTAIVDHASRVWREAKPDEYFFAEVYGAAVVENLVASLNGIICGLAADRNLMAIPHYSPGYSGWEIAEQERLFSLITTRAGVAFPRSLEVLPSGMLRPKKSLLGVFGLVERTRDALAAPALVPCERCAFEPCRYRRRPYIHSAVAIEESTPRKAAAGYTVSPKALAKWAEQRVRFAHLPGGRISAVFRFDGSTCSNMGQPLAFDYSVVLASGGDGHRILKTECRPATDDTGHALQCGYLRNPAQFTASIAEPPEILGRPLDDVMAWKRETRQSGCYCDQASRAHKWGLALETIHYALRHTRAPTPPSPDSQS
ncbi:MAG: hypothetical protein R3F07_15455 [Opitutaceae bacterium]